MQLERNHALGLSGLLLLLAIIFEIVSASSYPEVQHPGTHMNQKKQYDDAKKMENIARFHNLALICVLGAVATGVHGLALDAQKLM